ncbi:hybrid sensor histidine kinase/response regulator transcription factor [Maribellus sediminis]|uniref:hybrid sensor histidine kinase/response regulator transcription factor n=1 Tax=Maribellus sediminis TaxID=2696285 RepID=UPI0014309910|nr:response regulator [Maribellus sediminis]
MQTITKIIYTLQLVLLIFLQAAAQNEKNVQFYNLNEEYGISMRETNQVCEDDNGFIWISSKMGILRYTHDDIRVYQVPYESEDIITVRLEYMNKTLYAYTNNGQIFKYNTIQDKFEIVTNVTKYLEDTHITVERMLVDASNTFWEASSFGLLSYNNNKEFKIYFPNEQVQFIEWLDDHRFFCAIDGSIQIFNTETLVSEEYFSFPEDKQFYISYMEYDRKENSLWLGTLSDGLYYLNFKNGELQLKTIEKIPGQPIQAIEPISGTALLIGIDGQGVWEIDKETQKIISIYKEDSDNQNSLRGNGVYDIFCDRNSRVWICTYSGGVSFFDQASSSAVTKISHIVNNRNSLVNNDVNSVLEDRNGNLWFATNNGISRWNVRTNTWNSFYHNMEQNAQVFLTLYEDSKGRIWAGTYSSGVYILDGNTGTELKHLNYEQTKGNFEGDFIFNITEDSQGTVWIGGVRGDLIRYNTKNDTYNSYDNYTIYIIEEFGPDKLLMGTTYGLLLFDKNTGTHEVMVEGFVVYDILLKDDDVIWMATNGDGIIRYDIRNKTVERFTVDSGLPSNFVNSIIYANGYLWIGTELGLCRLDESDMTILTFNSLLYLNNVSFNQDAHYLLSNGNLILGSNVGALMFNPEDLKSTQEQGQIYIQDISVSGRSIRDIENLAPSVPINKLDEISLRYFQNTLSLELIPIGLQSPGAKFSWMIEEMDMDWSKPANNRILSYSNLSSGDFTLKIRMFDNSLTKIISERIINIRIVPPFWERLWFKLVATLFVAGIIIFGFFFYIDRLKTQHSEEKIRFFANTAHDIRTSLTLITGPIEELNKEENLSNDGLNYLHLATDQVQRLSKVVTQLMDFQKVDVGKEKVAFKSVDIIKVIENRVMMFESLAKRNNIELVFNANCEHYQTSVDERMIDKVIDNLISNAIKYSFPNSMVNITLRCIPSRWTLEVQDTGIGISKKAQKLLFREYYRGENAINTKIVGSGIGLLLVKNYVSMHGGKITCVSQKKMGSTFQVTIPYSEKNDATRESKTADQSMKDMYTLANVGSTINKEADSGNNKMKVLIVEDHEYLREFLNSAMQKQFIVYLAEDGEEAWKIIQKNSPDLVVSDIMMPKMDGFELCKKIKSTYETSHIPIILLTALAGKAQQLQGLGMGADDYLTKPFDVTLLQQRIKTLIRNRETIRDKAVRIIKLDDEQEVILDNELNDKFLKKMVETVRANLANPQFSKNDFAAAMHVSPSLLYKKVKSLTDQSPTEFIKIFRLEHSLTLLKEQKHTITEISELCGFASVGYYSTVFRKHYGKSPTQVFEK